MAEILSPEKVHFSRSKLQTRIEISVISEPKFTGPFHKRRRNQSGNVSFPIFDILSHFGDIRDQSRRLYQWRREGGGGRGGHSPPAALSRGRHFEGRKYGILKIGRFWQIDVCIAERVGS